MKIQKPNIQFCKKMFSSLENYIIITPDGECTGCKVSDEKIIDWDKRFLQLKN